MFKDQFSYLKKKVKCSRYIDFCFFMNPHSGIIIDIKLSGFFAEFCPASVFSETRLSFLALKRPPAG